MRIDQMHYNFFIGLDRVASNDRPDLMPWEVDEYLNRAITQFVKTRYSLNDQIKKGFETDQKRIDALASLHIKSPEVQPPVTPILITNGIYEVRLNSLGNNVSGQYFRYMYMTKLRVLIKRDDCLKTIDATNWQIDDGKTLYNMPSWKWGRVHANYGKSSFVTPPVNSTVVADSMDFTSNLITQVPNPPGPNLTRLNNDELKSVYLDTLNKYGEQEFEIVEVYPSYIKRPNRVFIGGYNHIDGHSTSSSQAIHCDIDSAYHDEIINLAVEMAASEIQDMNLAQLKNQKNTQEYIT